MQVMSEASKYRNLDSKRDLIKVIREKAKVQGRNMKNYKVAELNTYSKPRLFCMFAKIDFEKEKEAKGEQVNSFSP